MISNEQYTHGVNSRQKRYKKHRQQMKDKNVLQGGQWQNMQVHCKIKHIIGTQRKQTFNMCQNPKQTSNTNTHTRECHNPSTTNTIKPTTKPEQRT